jgi:hypothetical protein
MSFNPYYASMYDALSNEFPPGTNYQGVSQSDRDTLSNMTTASNPMAWDTNFSTYIQAASDYLTNSNAVVNVIKTFPTYLPGSNTSTPYLDNINRITSAPTRTLRQAFVQYSLNATNATYQSNATNVINTWSNVSLYTYNIQNPPTLPEVSMELEFFNSVISVVVGLIPLAHNNVAAAKAGNTRTWVINMMKVLEASGMPQHDNNIKVSCILARALCRLYLGGTGSNVLTTVSSNLNSFVSTNCPSGGFLQTEKREGHTIDYQYRCAINILYTECLLVRAKHKIDSSLTLLSSSDKGHLQSLINRLNGVATTNGTEDIPNTDPPDYDLFFHSNASYTGVMGTIKTTQVSALQQMLDYINSVDPDITTGLVNTKWYYGSVTYGDLKKVLDAIPV